MKKRVSNHYEIEMNITDNPFNLDIDNLFQLATRNNKKRRFLLISKILGKHLPIKPSKVLEYSRLLTDEFEKRHGKEDEDCLVIGFAETATAMGQIVFDGIKNAKLLCNTTREVIGDIPYTIKFEEEHSHATSHYLYLGKNPNVERVVLVDDELSTGKTVSNIIKQLKEILSVKKFTVITYLDFRNDENQELMKLSMEEDGIELDVISLVKGEIGNVYEDIDVINNLVKNEISEDNLNRQVDESKINRIQLDDNFFEHLELSKLKEGEISKVSYWRGSGRFSIEKSYHQQSLRKIENISNELQGYVKGKTLILGWEELMYFPMMVASSLGGDIYFKSVTRSPIIPEKSQGYPIKSRLILDSIYNEEVKNYIYNLEEENYETIIIFNELETDLNKLKDLKIKLQTLCNNLYVVAMHKRLDELPNPPKELGSYSKKDVSFLLKELGNEIKEEDNMKREHAIQAGVHYSEMLPVEYSPSDEYIRMYESSLDKFSDKIAKAVAIVSEKIIINRGKNLVLVSLARAGTPAGILIKRYIENKYEIEVPHYCISIIRGKGIDENALKYICEYHKNEEIQFIDGWTGKGAITRELKEAVDKYKKDFDIKSNLSHELAVIADPGHCTRLYGTREDFLIPNACLNSTVSGLISRTVHRSDLIGKYDFHGVKYYKELESHDKSLEFIEIVSSYFNSAIIDIDYSKLKEELKEDEIITWRGQEDVTNIERDFGIESLHYIKPGIGETTRVLLRRIPWKILVRKDAKNIDHVLQLAKEKNIEVEEYPLRAYQCCGIVKSLKGE